MSPEVGDRVRVDTWPGAVWRVVAPTSTDDPGTYRMVRLDRAGGSRVELSGILAERLRE